MTDARKTAILLMGYGTPDSLKDIPDYYANIRSGRPVSETVVDQLIARYQKIGGRSPLLTIIRSIQKKLEEAVHLPVYLGMLYWKPYIIEAVQRMLMDDIQHVIAVCLTPHYSRMSIGLYQKHLQQACQQVDPPFSLTFISNWHDHPEYIQGVVQNIRRTLENNRADRMEDVTILFSAHSLPVSIIEQGDPYAEQVSETAALVARQLQWPPERTSLAYQSAPRKDGTWLTPEIEGALVEISRKGSRMVMVVPIGFVIDNMEILYDIDIELKAIAESVGLTLLRSELLNDGAALIATLKSLVQQHLPGPKESAGTSSVVGRLNDLN